MPDELDAFLDDLRTAATAVPDPAVGDALATLFRDGTVPVAPPALRVRRGRTGARAVVAGAVAGLAFGGLGVAGALPRPVQQRVADVVDHVGVHLPDARPATTTTTSTTSTTTSTTVPALPVTTTTRPGTPPTTADDHGGSSGRDGGDDTSGDDRSGADDSHGSEDSHGGSAEEHGKSDDDGNADKSGKGGGDDAVTTTTQVVEQESSGKGRSARNPVTSGDVHVDNGSHSGHDDGGTE
jgi:hypothetical protein